MEPFSDFSLIAVNKLGNELEEAEDEEEEEESDTLASPALMLCFCVRPSVCLSGSDFQCSTHIIPVKNEEGVVMMFILNFDYVLDEESDNSTEKISPASPTKSDQSECHTKVAVSLWQFRAFQS